MNPAVIPQAAAPAGAAPAQAQSGLATLAVHLGGVLAGRAAGAALVWSRPIFPAHEEHVEIRAVLAGPEGGLEVHFEGDPQGAPLRLFGPREIVLDEHGLRIKSATRVEWGDLVAEWLPPGWVRLTSQGRTTEFEVGRREALLLEPALGETWLDGFGHDDGSDTCAGDSEDSKE